MHATSEIKVFDEIALLLQKPTLLASQQNRELSESEADRMLELRKKFRAGTIKTEKTLSIGEN